MPKRRDTPVCLIADDDEFVREHLAIVLSGADLEVTEATDGTEAIAALRDQPDVAVLDLDMPGATGLEVLRFATKNAPDTPVLMLSGAGEVADAVTALKHGAFDYITKPFQEDELIARIREALKLRSLQQENEKLRSVNTAVTEQVRLIAEAPATKRVLELANKCAAVDSTVLITGPSGTGKTALARWVHQQSSRSKGPFVTLNCGAIPRELIESELFGHEKGAFTGADAQRTGKFEAAAGGTILLDEIGELPLDLQPKLLSALQDRAITKVGSSEEIKIDVRVIAATNRDLTTAIDDQSFREDLYYRLNVLTIEMPPLRERADDVPPLADHTLERISARIGIAKPELSERSADLLKQYRWPGNVRELENILERALIFAEDGDLYPALETALTVRQPQHDLPGLAGVPLAELERKAILATLEACGGNRAKAAELLGVSERTVYNKLKDLKTE